MSERDLWAAVAEAAISDHARLIAAARKKGRRNTLTTADGRKVVVGSLQAEIDAARQYFESRDWRMISSFAGLDIAASDIMTVVQEGLRWQPNRSDKAIQQGAA